MTAAVLLPGSGPTDRNRNRPTLTPCTLTELAEALAREAFARNPQGEALAPARRNSLGLMPRVRLNAALNPNASE